MSQVDSERVPAGSFKKRYGMNIWSTRAEALKIRRESRIHKPATEIPALIDGNSPGCGVLAHSLSSTAPFHKPPSSLDLP